MRFPSSKVIPRYIVIAIVFIATAVAILAKAGYTMTVERKYWTTVKDSSNNRIITIPPSRGNIYADGGEVLAATVPAYDIYLDFMSYEKDTLNRRKKDQHKRDSVLYAKVDSVSELLAEVLKDKTAEEYKAHILKGREDNARHLKLNGKRYINYTQYSQIRSLAKIRWFNFNAEKHIRRCYPYGNLAKRTIGRFYAGKDTAMYGLEVGLDTILRGTPGKEIKEKKYNSTVNIPITPVVNGCDVHTTLNVVMQNIVEEALREKLEELSAEYGLCILMEVETGDVKAITTIGRAKDGKYYPIQNWALSQRLAPGSVFKPMSFLVAFNDDKIELNTPANAGNGTHKFYDRTMRDASWRNGGAGMITVAEAIERSSNVAVSTTIDRIYRKDTTAFINGIYKLGVGEDLKLPIPGYAIPKIRPRMWSGTTLPWMSIGYETEIPPISTLTFYNGIANGGKMVRPRFVTHLTRDDEIVKEYPVSVIRQQMAKPEAIANIQECLSRVVKGKHATGKKARSEKFEIAGKTGTAQIWSDKGFQSQYIVSFAGYFPADKPKYSMIVCIKEGPGASGGGHCGPVFRKVAENVMALNLSTNYALATDSINAHMPTLSAGDMNAMERILTELNIKNDLIGMNDNYYNWGSCNYNNDKAILATENTFGNVMPKVIGYGLRDAVFRLENLGLKVKAKGVGKVTMQSIAPGTKIARNQEVIIWLGNRKGNENDSTMTAQNNKDNPRKGNGNDQPKTKAVNPATPQKNGERKG